MRLRHDQGSNIQHPNHEANTLTMELPQPVLLKLNSYFVHNTGLYKHFYHCKCKCAIVVLKPRLMSQLFHRHCIYPDYYIDNYRNYNLDKCPNYYIYKYLDHYTDKISIITQINISIPAWINISIISRINISIIA